MLPARAVPIVSKLVYSLITRGLIKNTCTSVADLGAGCAPGAPPPILANI